MSWKVILVLQIVLCTIVQVKLQLDEWKIPCGAVYLPKNCTNANVETLEIVEDYERCAPARLDPLIRDFVWRASGRETTLFENKEAFNRILIKKRVLQGNANYSLETTVFGRRIAFPVGVKATVGHSVFYPDGERAIARGASKAGAIMIVHSKSLTSLEDIAAAVSPNTELWIQTNIFPKRELTVQLVQRAEKAAYKAIVVTVDGLPGTEIRCKARTRFFERYVNGRTPNLPFASSKDTDIDASLTFNDITWLTGITKLPIIVKGIMTAEDALQAIAAGASAIIVSNQGGRELEWSLPTIEALPAIVKAVKPLYPWIDIFIDSGVRSGHDIYKALARGAKAALIGRPITWGLVIAGEKGVTAVLNIYKEEFKQAMLHAGFANPSLITNSSIVSQSIYRDFY